MTGKRITPWIASAIVVSTMIGCVTSDRFSGADFASILAETELIASPSDLQPVNESPTELDQSAQPSVSLASEQVALSTGQLAALAPFSVRGATSPEWVAPKQLDLTIDQAIQIALANSTVMRDLGARLVQAPSLTPTIYGPAIQATDATSGIDAALSAFDAQLTGDLFFENNDRILNNASLTGGANMFQQELARFQSSLSKRAATGTLFSLRHNFDGDLNNAEQNLLGKDRRAWTWNIEGEVRQPLLQGRGTLFNRIAGPNATPGVYNGVLIARLRTDTTIAQLEIALRDYLSDVENAYWDLYFAYADLEVKTKARDRSLSTLRLLEAREGLPDAERDKVAQAKEQYFRFEQEVQDSLGGRLVVGTRGFNGSGGGTFQGVGGVYANERRLRLIMGLPINDGQLIRTTSRPSEAPATYDWNDVVGNALARRSELRRQQLIVDQRQLELTASRNFTMPRLDAVGTYRYRALGDRIYYPEVVDEMGNSISTGTHEWLLGLSLAYPVGLRQAHAGVRNAQLRLSRERELLREVERQVVYGVSNAIAENDRAYEVLRVAINREQAAREQYTILFPKAEGGFRQFDFNALLDSERRLAEAENNTHRAAVQYALATKNLNFEMGTLLEYSNIHLVDGDWPRQNVSSARRDRVIQETINMNSESNVPYSSQFEQSDSTPSATLWETVPATETHQLMPTG